MTTKQINTMVAAIAAALKCDYAYSHFNEPHNRFLVFYYQGDDDVYADGQNYQNIAELVIEFYTPTKELNSEKTIKTMLNNYGLSCDKVETWINDEKVFMTQYNTEVIING